MVEKCKDLVILDGYTTNPGDLLWNDFAALEKAMMYDWTEADEVVSRLSDASAALTNKVRIDREHLRRLPNLKYIGIMATGVDTVDLEAARESGVVVTSVPTYANYSVAQLTFALILELCYDTSKHTKSVIEDKVWSFQKLNSYWLKPLMGLENKTIGIVGMGRIGERVAKIAGAFDMKVLAYDVNRREIDNVSWASLEQLLENSDIVTLHCPLFEMTRGIMNKKTLAMMKRTAFLINTSRGPLVVEKDLAEALNNGTIAGAGLDVLENEPPDYDSPILSAKNVVITPHIGWATLESRARLMQEVSLNYEAFLRGEARNVVNT